MKLVTGEDITAHGTGNVGAMNVRRTTGSWGWFVVAMVADAFKGLVPTLAAKYWSSAAPALVATAMQPWGVTLRVGQLDVVDQPAVLRPDGGGCRLRARPQLLVWMALIKRHFARTGKGLATGAGALLAYDWRYFVAVVVVGLAVIAITRYMMAGQVAAAVTLPVAALVAAARPTGRSRCSWALVVYAAHHKRFVGLLQGKEPKLYINDRMGPRG